MVRANSRGSFLSDQTHFMSISETRIYSKLRNFFDKFLLRKVRWDKRSAVLPCLLPLLVGLHCDCPIPQELQEPFAADTNRGCSRLLDRFTPVCE